MQALSAGNSVTAIARKLVSGALLIVAGGIFVGAVLVKYTTGWEAVETAISDPKIASERADDPLSKTE